VKWSRVVDRSAATRNARNAGPGFLDYWLERLGPEFAEASERQRLDAADAARRAYYAGLALKSAKARARRRGGGDAVA
jgi:hypothetical protein